MLLFCSLFCIFLLTLNVSAQTCTDNQRILRISDISNAHGEVYNGAGNYGTQICFPSLFPGYPVGPNPHDCTGTNLVLRLSDYTNAHAQTPDYTGINYPRNVCYGDLICVSSTSACPSGQTEVVSLSADTNAHLGTAGSSNYNTRICCRTNSPQIYNPIWKYYDGTVIPAGANICSNHIITASVQTVSMADNSQIQFNFYDRDLGRDDKIATLFAPVLNNQANIILNLSDSVIRQVIQGQLPDGDNRLELFFRANYSTYSNESYDIYYQDNSSLCSFSSPIANITAPVHRGVYFLNSNSDINFVSGCTSQIGPVQNEWTITQGSNSFTRTGSNFPHRFTSPGQTNVKLRCTDLAGNYDIAESQMLIVASPYVLAYIQEPEFNEFVYTTPPTSGPYFPQSVPFNASDSFAVDVNGCSVQCIGGDCPAETKNVPAGCTPNPSGGISITSATGGNNLYNTLNFNWRFWDQDWSDEWINFEGNGIYQGTAQYDDLSNSVNDKHMSVSITHTNGANAVFEREFTLGRCLNNGNTYYASGSLSYSTNQENDYCKGGDFIAGTADDCCAAGLRCMPGVDNRALYSCQISGNITLECSDFTNQNACNSNNNTAIPLASYGGNPPPCTFLQCFWDTASSRCGVRATQYANTSTGACNVGGGPILGGNCAYTTTTSECINGRKTISYNVVSGTCPSRPSVTVPCGSLNFELSFFGIRQFLFAILLIASVYFVFNFFKGKIYAK